MHIAERVLISGDETAFVYRARIALHTIKLFFLRNGLLEHQHKSTCQPASPRTKQVAVRIPCSQQFFSKRILTARLTYSRYQISLSRLRLIYSAPRRLRHECPYLASHCCNILRRGCLGVHWGDAQRHLLVPLVVGEVPAEHEAVCRFERILQISAERPSELSASAHCAFVKRNSYPSRDTAKFLREVADMANPTSVVCQVTLFPFKQFDSVAGIALAGYRSMGRQQPGIVVGRPSPFYHSWRYQRGSEAE